MATDVVDVPMTEVPPREWWQVWAQHRAQWWAARPVLAARWATIRAVGLWVALVWVLVLVVLMPDLRLALRAYLGCVWVVVAWWALARTKTLTWSGFMKFFAGSVVWSVVIGVLATFLAVAATAGVTGAGPTVMIAGIVEETLKLLPVVLVAVVAPRRAARFAAVDWALLGVASGTAFLAAEESARRVYLLVVDNLGTVIARAFVDGNGIPEDWVRFRAIPVPTDWADGPAGFGGHAVMTAIVTGLLGLALVAWRRVRGSRGVGAWAVRALAVALPILALVSAVADHAGFNAQGQGTATLAGDGTPKWLDPATSTIPWWVRVPWSALGHGHGRGTVLVLVIATALLVDASRLAGAPGSALRALPAPTWVVAPSAALVARTPRWPSWLSRAAAGVVGAVLALVWTVGRDLAEQAAARVTEPGRPRLAAARTAGTVASSQRALREAAFDLFAAPVHARRRRVFSLTVLVLLLLAALVLAPRAASTVGPMVFDLWGWFAGVLDALGSWWHDQPVGTQIAIGVGIAALIALSGGSLGVAFGVSGVLTWGLDKSHGIADFARDPDGATRSYFATATPGQLAADTLGVALTFAPGNFAGATVGHGIRTIATDVVADPAGWLAARRLQLADDAGVLDPGAFLRREPVPLGDGSVQPALSAAEEAAAVARYEALPRVPLNARGPELDYQLRVYGDNERVVQLAEGKTLPDGFSPTYGALGDAKYVSPSSVSSFYAPRPGSGLETVAIRELDRRLLRLAEAADTVGGSRTFEYVTNSPAAAQFLESRIVALGLRGYVRLVP